MFTSFASKAATSNEFFSHASLTPCTSNSKRALYMGELATTDEKPAAAPKIIITRSNNQYLRMKFPVFHEEPPVSPLPSAKTYFWRGVPPEIGSGSFTRRISILFFSVLTLIHRFHSRRVPIRNSSGNRR